MESVLKSLFKRELKAILAPYSDIIYHSDYWLYYLLSL